MHKGRNRKEHKDLKNKEHEEEEELTQTLSAKAFIDNRSFLKDLAKVVAKAEEIRRSTEDHREGCFALLRRARNNEVNSEQ